MGRLGTRLALLVVCFQLADFTEPPCVIDLECPECIPENMPLVTSHRAVNGSVVAASGDELVLACFGGKFLAHPLAETLTLACEAGRYRVPGDGTLRHLLELGCQENIFEDVLHQVERCGAPLQGRAYVSRGPRGVAHLAVLCYSADRGLAARALAGPALAAAPHDHRLAPLSLLGNFNHMFDAKTRHDAERLYSDEVRMNRRLHELFKHDQFSFADQTLTSAKLLSSQYFEDQNMRVSEFVSNRVAVWGSVARGNLQHLQRDVAGLLRTLGGLRVHAGTHGVLSLRTGRARTDAFLAPGGRFPVPRYVWTVVHAPALHQALAVVVLNDPFVAVSEIRDAVFCESACGRVAWLHELRRNRNYEVPLNGLVFCCSVQNFTDVVTEMPKDEVTVPAGASGMLTDFFG